MIICVEGLIGVGKSTLCETLGALPQMEAFFEPVDSNPFLPLYYADSKRWAYTMQMHLMQVRKRLFDKAMALSDEHHDCIMDRSYFGDYAFAIVQKRLGLMTPEEFASYVEWHRYHQRTLGFPDLILRLVLPYEEEIRRINARARECESGIDPVYLVALGDAYDVIFEELRRECSVIEIDASMSRRKVVEAARAAIERVRSSGACLDERYPHYKRV